MPASIRVMPVQLGAGAIHPFQYGQFVEYLCDLVPGMWAEKLYDGSFEGPLPYRVRFRPETDFRERPWFPVGSVECAEYALDETDPFNGRVSQRIRIDGAATAGIAQDGLFVAVGHALRLSVHLRGDVGPVRARIMAGSDLLAEATFSVTADWTRRTAGMTPAATARDAALVLDFRGPGAVWLDQVSLMPEETVGGWRPDVVAALRGLRPGILRFGGSTIETFDWRLLVGDPEKRPPWPNDPWGGRHPSAAGLEELIGLCRAVDAEPLFCVRVTGRTPEDAAAQVEYFNGGPETPMGRLRAAHGHARPHAVRYWQVGNELGGDEYARELAAFCAAMRAVDPSIRLLSAYPSEAVLREAGRYLDYVCPHHYGCADLVEKAADLDRLRAVISEHAPGRDIRVGVTEWNTTAGDFGLKRAMLWSLDNALACSRYQNLLHRYAGFVEITNRSNLTNSFCSGILQTDPASLYKTPTYYAQQLYATLGQPWPMAIESTGFGPYDLSATLSDDRDRLTLFVVNGADHPVEAAIDLEGIGRVPASGTAHRLIDTHAAGEPHVANSLWEPDRVRTVPEPMTAGTGRLDHVFPALSLSALELNLDRA